MCTRVVALHAVLDEQAHVVVAVMVKFAPLLRVRVLVLIGECAGGDACAGCGCSLARARPCTGGAGGLPWLVTGASWLCRCGVSWCRYWFLSSDLPRPQPRCPPLRIARCSRARPGVDSFLGLPILPLDASGEFGITHLLRALRLVTGVSFSKFMILMLHSSECPFGGGGGLRPQRRAHLAPSHVSVLRDVASPDVEAAHGWRSARRWYGNRLWGLPRLDS